MMFVFYRDPERGWDSSKVKGLVANLFSVTDVSNATALEVVAGGRLYNVVVDNEVRPSLQNIITQISSLTIYIMV